LVDEKKGLRPAFPFVESSKFHATHVTNSFDE